MRKVFLDALPKHNDNSNEIDWNKSIGYTVNFTYDDINGTIKIINFDNKSRFLYIKYLDQDIFKINTSSLRDCRLGKLLGKHTKEFKFSLNTIFKDNNRDLTIIGNFHKTRESDGYLEKWYKFHCNKCGYNGEKRETGFVSGEGCPCCCIVPTVIQVGINDMWTTVPEIAKMLANPQDGYNYTKCSKVALDWKCLDCGNIIKNIPISRVYNQGLSCHQCSDGISYPEKLMFNVLQQLNIDFEYQYRPKWCMYKFYNKNRIGIYDFYIPSINCIIEMDGGLGHGNKDTKQLTKEESQTIDNKKDKLANEHNIEVIRIDCQRSELSYIKNSILHSKFSELFNLSEFNWKLADCQSQKSLVKKVCELWNKYPHSTKYLREYFKLGNSSVITYLKKGNELGWCIYSSEYERKYKGHPQKHGRPIEIFKNNISIGKFENLKTLSNRSKELYGVYLYFQTISDVCKNKRESYKGFTFQFIDYEKFIEGSELIA